MSEGEGQPTDASYTDFGPLQRVVFSYVTRLINAGWRHDLRTALRERMRRVRGATHRVIYYHEVADPYSHLAAQALDALCDRYDIEIVPRLTAMETGSNRPEPELLAGLARRDCALIAPHYGLSFPSAAGPPDPQLVARGERLLVAVERTGDARAFARAAVAVGNAIWGGDASSMAALAADTPGTPDITDAEAEQSARAALRERSKLGHYSGAMFHYAGEWYWGVDRLHHLERRWTKLGAAKTKEGFCFGRPRLETAPVKRGDELTLEIFPSLRSPYTAIGFEPALDLAKATGIRRITRPVLPMVMRGVPTPLVKGLYIFGDARREGAALGMTFGRMVDPVGGPVRRAYSIWPWAEAKGRGDALISSFLRATWSEGINTSTDAGLRTVVERAGLDWAQARSHIGDDAWESELEKNRVMMIEEMGQWGVPGFRLRGPDGEPELVLWGQDRIWLLSREIQRRGAAPLS